VKVKGFYYIEHQATGQVYTGTSADAQKDATDLVASLTTASCRIKRLTKLCKLDNKVKAKVMETNTLAEARALEKEFRSKRQDYVLIN